MKATMIHCCKKTIPILSFFVITCLFQAGMAIQKGYTQNHDQAYTERITSGATLVQVNALLSKVIDLEVENRTRLEALQEIAEKTGFHVSYDTELPRLHETVHVQLFRVTTEEALWAVLKGSGLRFSVSKNRQLVLFPFDEPAEMVQATVSGTVVDAETGETLIGVNIMVEELNIGTATDVDGRFEISGIPEGEYQIVATYIGYTALRRTISVTDGETQTIELQLVASTSELEELVVTALGISREARSLGYSAQTVGEDELTASRELSISNYLTGKVSGVQISNTAGGAGSSTNVVIRGNSSISGNNQPLWVVDGVPIINYSNSSSGSGIASADIDYGDGIGDLNPQDVESMNVLKGPAATALYGSRGANGVIIVSTKSGQRKQGIGVEVNSGITFDELNLLPNYQNQYGGGYDDESYANYSWGGFTFDGVYYPWPENGYLDSWGGPLDGSIKIPNWWTLPEDGSIPSSVWDNPITEAIPMVAQPYDNVRNFFDRGYTQSNNIAVTAAGDNTRMRLSLGNNDTKGIVPNHSINKNSVSFSGSAQVTDRLSFDGRVNYIRTDGAQRPATGYSASNPFQTLISMTRYTPLDFIKHQYETTGVNIRYPGINYNPYYIVNEVRNNDTKNRVIGFTSATFMVTDWLSLTGRASIDFYNEERENTWPLDPNSRNAASRLGQMNQLMRRARDLNGDIMLNADRDITENINLTGVLGANIRSFNRNDMSWDAREFKSEGVYHISNFNDVRPSASIYEKEMQSVYFTAQVGYKSYLFLNITGRNDWSSALGADNRSFFYPSVSTSIVFTEAFGIDSEILSFGKLRASWAQVGNDSAPYLTRSGYSLYSTGFNGQAYASKSGTLPLWDLKNELTESYEAGVDLRFFNNLASLDVTYYDASTTDQILSLPVSVSSGYNTAVINAGEIRNKGIEISVGLTPVQTSDFSWTINANYASNQSEVVVLDGNIQTYKLIQNSGDPATSDIHAQVGAPYGNIIGYAYKRAPDGQKIVSQEGVYLREDEPSVLGNITPDWIGGLNNTFSYKGVTLNVLLDFVQGGDVVSSTKYEMTRKGTGAWTVEGRRPKPRYTEGDNIPAGSSVGDPMPYVGVLDGVVEVEDANGNITYEKNTKAVSGQNYWARRAWDGIGEEFVEDGSYIALREVMLHYELPFSLINKIPFSGVTVSVFGRNLGYLQNNMDYLGLSPETAPNTSGGASGIEALAVPSTRSYGFNIKLAF